MRPNVALFDDRQGGALALLVGAGFIAWRSRVVAAAKERKRRQRLAEEEKENDLSSEGNDKKVTSIC
jgi:hypothetical protein